MAHALKVVGLMNVQFAIQNGVIYVLEVNPRASRTVPFVSKATGLALAKIAARCMVGTSLAAQNSVHEVVPPYFSVKEAVFPFIKFPGADTILGPEMKSTGEVMGVGATFGEAFVKSQLAAGDRLPESGKGIHRRARCGQARGGGHRTRSRRARFPAGRDARSHQQRWLPMPWRCCRFNKVAEGMAHVVDMIKNSDVAS